MIGGTRMSKFRCRAHCCFCNNVGDAVDDQNKKAISKRFFDFSQIFCKKRILDIGLFKTVNIVDNMFTMYWQFVYNDKLMLTNRQDPTKWIKEHIQKLTTNPHPPLYLADYSAVSFRFVYIYTTVALDDQLHSFPNPVVHLRSPTCLITPTNNLCPHP